jgi:hypothetical protein
MSTKKRETKKREIGPESVASRSQQMLLDPIKPAKKTRQSQFLSMYRHFLNEEKT